MKVGPHKIGKVEMGEQTIVLEGRDTKIKKSLRN